LTIPTYNFALLLSVSAAYGKKMTFPFKLLNILASGYAADKPEHNIILRDNPANPGMLIVYVAEDMGFMGIMQSQ
jgi:hypothetical protein